MSRSNIGEESQRLSKRIVDSVLGTDFRSGISWTSIIFEISKSTTYVIFVGKKSVFVDETPRLSMTTEAIDFIVL